MDNTKTISIKQFCIHYEVPVSFIDSLSEFELIEIVNVNNHMHLREDLVDKVEQLIRLHYDLNINFEGLDVVMNLIGQITTLKQEASVLNNKIAFYIED